MSHISSRWWRWKLEKILSLALLLIRIQVSVLGCQVDCNQVLVAPEGSFSSPCYPGDYPKNQACRWTLRAPAGFVVQITFLDFELEEALRCIYDRLVVDTGSNNVSFCGLTANGLSLNSTGNFMEVSFNSDFSVQKRGFNISYRQVAVALRNQKVTIPQSAGKTVKLLSHVAVPALSQFSICFEVARASQRAGETIFTYSEQNTALVSLGKSAATEMELSIGGVTCPLGAALSANDFTSAMKLFCLTWSSLSGDVGVFANGNHKSVPCANSVGKSIKGGGTFQLGGKTSFDGFIYNFRMWDFNFTTLELQALTCDTVGNVFDWEYTFWDVQPAHVQTDSTLSCICYPNCTHLTTAAPSSGSTLPSILPTICPSPGLNCPATTNLLTRSSPVQPDTISSTTMTNIPTSSSTVQLASRSSASTTSLSFTSSTAASSVITNMYINSTTAAQSISTATTTSNRMLLTGNVTPVSEITPVSSTAAAALAPTAINGMLTGAEKEKMASFWSILRHIEVVTPSSTPRPRPHIVRGHRSSATFLGIISSPLIWPVRKKPETVTKPQDRPVIYLTKPPVPRTMSVTDASPKPKVATTPSVARKTNMMSSSTVDSKLLLPWQQAHVRNQSAGVESFQVASHGNRKNKPLTPHWASVVGENDTRTINWTEPLEYSSGVGAPVFDMDAGEGAFSFYDADSSYSHGGDVAVVRRNPSQTMASIRKISAAIATVTEEAAGERLSRADSHQPQDPSAEDATGETPGCLTPTRTFTGIPGGALVQAGNASGMHKQTSENGFQGHQLTVAPRPAQWPLQSTRASRASPLSDFEGLLAAAGTASAPTNKQVIAADITLRSSSTSSSPQRVYSSAVTSGGTLLPSFSTMESENRLFDSMDTPTPLREYVESLPVWLHSELFVTEVPRTDSVSLHRINKATSSVIWASMETYGPTDRDNSEQLSRLPGYQFPLAEYPRFQDSRSLSPSSTIPLEQLGTTEMSAAGGHLELDSATGLEPSLVNSLTLASFSNPEGFYTNHPSDLGMRKGSHWAHPSVSDLTDLLLYAAGVTTDELTSLSSSDSSVPPTGHPHATVFPTFSMLAHFFQTSLPQETALSSTEEEAKRTDRNSTLEEFTLFSAGTSPLPLLPLETQSSPHVVESVMSSKPPRASELRESSLTATGRTLGSPRHTNTHHLLSKLHSSVVELDHFELPFFDHLVTSFPYNEHGEGRSPPSTQFLRAPLSAGTQSVTGARSGATPPTQPTAFLQSASSRAGQSETTWASHTGVDARTTVFPRTMQAAAPTKAVPQAASSGLSDSVWDCDRSNMTRCDKNTLTSTDQPFAGPSSAARSPNSGQESANQSIASLPESLLPPESHRFVEDKPALPTTALKPLTTPPVDDYLPTAASNEISVGITGVASCPCKARSHVSCPCGLFPGNKFYRITFDVTDEQGQMTEVKVENALKSWLNQSFQSWEDFLPSIRVQSRPAGDKSYTCLALLKFMLMDTTVKVDAVIQSKLRSFCSSVGLSLGKIAVQPVENCEAESSLFYKWSESKPTATQFLPCFPNKEQNAFRTCMIEKQNYTSVWGPANISNCVVSPENAAEVASNLTGMTYNNLSTEDVSNVVTQLKDIVNVAKINSTLASTMVTIFSNVMTSSDTFLSTSSEMMLKTVDELALKIEFEGTFLSITSKHLALGISAFNSSSFNGTSFSAYIPANSTDLQINFESSQQNSLATVTLPSTLLSNLSFTDADVLSRINFIFFNNTGLFKEKKLNSYVVASSVGNRSINNLQDPVEIDIVHLSPKPENSTVTCAFWDFNFKNGSGGWNSEGCTLNWSKSNTSRTVCLCNHLTHFGILMDFQRLEPLSDNNNKALTFISYIGCIISAICSAVTLFTYIAFEKLRRDYPSKILMNLSASLLLLNMAYILDNWLASIDADGLCISMAAFLHFFLLTTFTWMGLESIHMYIALVKVFNTYIRRYILKFCLVGWGLPAAIVIIVVSVDRNFYGKINYEKDNSSQFCWVKDEGVFYAACVGYFCVIFIMNVAMFIVVMNQICGRKGKRSNRTKREEVLRNLRSAVSLTFLLGMTWVFAFFAWGPVRLPFLYLFCIFNSLQGLFIFIFHCALKENVQKQWRRYLCCTRFRLPDNSDWSKTATNNTKKVSSDNIGKSLSSCSFGSSTANWTSKAKLTFNPFTKRSSHAGKGYCGQGNVKGGLSEADTSSILPVHQVIDKVKGYCSARSDNFYKNIIMSDSFYDSTKF